MVHWPWHGKPFKCISDFSSIWRSQCPSPPLSLGINGPLISSAHMTPLDRTPGDCACLISASPPSHFPLQQSQTQHRGGFHASVPLDTLFLLPGRSLASNPARPRPAPQRAPIHPSEPSLVSPPPGKPFRPHDLITVSSTPLYFASLHCNYWFHQISSLPDLGLLQRWSCSGYSFCTPKLPFLSSKTELAPRLRLAQKPLFLPSASPVTPRGPSLMPFWCSGPTPRAGAHP